MSSLKHKHLPYTESVSAWGNIVIKLDLRNRLLSKYYRLFVVYTLFLFQSIDLGW
jgi:hypothetical protein